MPGSTARAAAVVALPVLITLGGLTMLGPFGTDAYLPALPTIREDLGAGASATQLTLTGYSIGMAVGQLIAGPLSDAIGRRRPLLVGSAAMAASGMAGALAPSLIILVVCCALMGVSAAFGIVVGRALIADVAAGQALTRAYALLGTLTGLGPVLGPLGGVVLLTTFGWRGIFGGLAAAAAAGFTAVALLVKESLPSARRVRGGLRTLVTNTRTVLRSRTYLGGALIVWFGFAGLFAYIAASAFVVQDVLGYSPLVYSIIFGLNGVGLIISGLICARLSGRWSDRALSITGLTIESAGALLVLISALIGWSSPWLLLPGMLLLAASMGFIFGPATAGCLRDLRHIAGTALAILGAVQFLAAGIVSPLVQLGNGMLAFALVCACCVALAWTGLLVHPRAEPEPHDVRIAGSEPSTVKS